MRTATSIVAVSMMSWLVAPRWTYGPYSSPTAFVRSATRGITGLPPRAGALGEGPYVEAVGVRPPAVTAVAASAGASPSAAWARVRAASASSRACRYAVSAVADAAGEPAHPGASRPVSSVDRVGRGSHWNSRKTVSPSP